MPVTQSDNTIIRKNSAGSDFRRRRVNLIEGSNVTLTVADDSANNEVDVTIASSGSDTISGTDTHVLFFDGTDTPAGDAGFTYNKTTNIATLGGLVTPDIHTVDSNTAADLIIIAGNAVSGDNDGGDITLTAGAGFGDGNGGNLTLKPGDYGGGLGSRGQIVLPLNNDWGEIDLNIQSQTTDDTDGQHFNLLGSDGLGTANGGNFTFTAGHGNTTDGVGNGGTFSINAGGGGQTAGHGGLLELIAGSAPTQGGGGDIDMRAGSAGTVGNFDGGDIFIKAGAPSGSGTAGKIFLNHSVTPFRKAELSMASLSADRTFTFPDATGTLALTANPTDITVPDEAYDATNWNGSLEVPTKNAVRDKIESVVLGSGFATTELDNLGTTAINAHLLFDTDATYDIGSSTVGVNDLHFGSGGVINFDGGDMTITHSADVLKFAGGRFGFGTATPGTYELLSATHDFGEFTSGQTVKVLEFSAIVSETDASVSNVILGVDAAISIGGEFSAVNNTQDWTAVIGMRALQTKINTLSGSTGTVTGAANLYIQDGGFVGATVTNQYGVYIEDLDAATNNYGIYIVNADTYAIWVDAGVTRLDGSVLFGTTVSPQANDGAALGSTTLQFSDLFLAEGGVINWDNGDATLTQVGDVVTLAGADLKVTSAGNASTSVLTTDATQTLTNKTLTSPTLTTPSAFTTGGTITLAENTSIALDPAGSADGKYTGITIAGTAGATLAFGDLVYLDPTDSRWELADANAAAGADGDSRGVLGICVLAAAADGSATTILLHGVVRADAAFPAMTINNPQYVSETAGDITGTQPTTTDVVIRVVGFALTADELYFNPDNSYITHT